MHALGSLIADLPEGTVVTDPDILESYRQDRAADPSAGVPLAVVRPQRTEEVQTVLRWASTHRVAVVPRGMGTGLSAGPVLVRDLQYRRQRRHQRRRSVLREIRRDNRLRARTSSGAG